MLQFFEFSRWPPPSSWIFEIAKFYWLFGWRGLGRISVPNFVKIGQSVVKILRFFDFSRWRSPPPWIVEFTKFYWLSVSGGPICTIVPNFVKFGRSIADILQFFEFSKIAAAAILDFWHREFLLAIWMERVETNQHANFRQNRSIGCEGTKIFRFFKMAVATIMDFWIRKILLADGVWRAKTHNCTKFC